MRMAEEWLKTWICLSFVFARGLRAARPRFDVSTDMGLVLVPADAEVETAIFRLRATDQDTDFPLIFEIIATTSPIVRVENLPCTLYNKVCQANVILTRRLVAGRLHDFVVRVRDSKGDVNSMQATISVTNSTTPRDKIFPHLPSLIMVPEDTKPEKELDYLLVESNPWSGKPVYIELWQPKELFKIRQKQIGSQTKGVITLIGDLDFEMQSMYTLTMYATDPYTEPGKDTRNIAGLHVVVIVQDVQDVPPVFTLAPPLTKINNSIKTGDLILRVHAEDGDKGVPRDITYGLISEGNPFTLFFNVSEITGEIRLAKPLEELTKIIHVGAPIVLKIVAEEIRSMRDEPPAQATIVELGLLLGEPGNTPPYFENDNYVAWIDENTEPGTVIIFTDKYSTRVRDEDIGKAGVFTLKLENNNGTFEINPTVAERNANFIITIRDNTLIDYEKFKNLRCKIVAQEVGPATNLSANVPLTIFLKDINDNIPIFDNPIYNVTIVENANAGTKVIQVHATDKDAGILGKIQYTKIIGDGSEVLNMNPDNGMITVSLGSVIDREKTPELELIVEAKDEDGKGLRGTATLIVNILDVNDNVPVFEKETYEFLMNAELTNFTTPVFLKALDGDSEAPNNLVRYEIIHGNYENKFYLNEDTGELTIRQGINKLRKVRQYFNKNLILNMRKNFKSHIDEEVLDKKNISEIKNLTSNLSFDKFHPLTNITQEHIDLQNQNRSRRAEISPLFTLTVRVYDLGVPHLSSTAQVRIMRSSSAFDRIVMFVMPGENPDPAKTAETLATITGSRVTIQEIKPYVTQKNAASLPDVGKRSVVVARVEQNGTGTLVDVDKIRASLTANGFGIISGMDNVNDNLTSPTTDDNSSTTNIGRSNSKNNSVIDSISADVTGYKVENKLLTWLLVLLGLLLLAAIITLIICCICPSCPFYMEPRKRRVHSSETLIIHSNGRPKRHLNRKPIKIGDGYYYERKEAWSADPGQQQWHFNRRNTKHFGIASLPGDIIAGHQNPEINRLRRATSLRLRADEIEDAGLFGDQMLLRSRVTNMEPQIERMYLENVDVHSRNYEGVEPNSLKKQELERDSDGIHGNEQMLLVHNRMRQQHFYRDGNAEILKLITRGEIDDHKLLGNTKKDFNHSNAKDILLQRFIEDQKLHRSQDLRDNFHDNFREGDINRSTESQQRTNESTEIIILPEKLELPRQCIYSQSLHTQDQMLNSILPRLVVERNYKSSDAKEDEGDEYRGRGGGLKNSMRDVEMTTETEKKGTDNASYVHEVELVKQNVLLTRLLLEKEARGLSVPLVDSSSFLETQSLPGHVAIATQTDRTAATQTEFFGRSRSDNEDFEDDHRVRRKSKLKERFETKEDFKTLKTIWVRTPIPEENQTWSGNKITTPTRTKIEVTESCKVSISPDILKENSSSLKSSESGCIEEDEDHKVLSKQAKIKPDLMQKTHQLTSKVACNSKKKLREAKLDNSSTTGSPEVKKKNTLMKNKIRKKSEKSMKTKILEKQAKSEKSHFMEPSFRVLEREISNIHQKIRAFGDKKLKIIKRDSEQMEKESKYDNGSMYDVSKKYEIIVNKKTDCTSRECSPTKIYVEEKIKNNEESKKNLKMEKQQKQFNNSSEFEDNGRLNRQNLNLNEKIMASSMQTKNQSKLKRQAHLQDFFLNSESEKLEKSESSKSKIDKLKDSTSSFEMKLDSTSCSSKDFGKQQNQIETQKIQKSVTEEKKSMRSQKLMTKLRPTGMIDIKRKVPSLEPKSIGDSKKNILKKNEMLDINKTSISDDNKSISLFETKENVYHINSTTSEDEKLNQNSKLSMIKESMTIDLDKLVKEVKDAVGKEISLFTQAAKDALNIKISNEFVNENTEKKWKNPIKLKETQKIESTIDKGYQEVNILQSNEDKISETIERRDSKDRTKSLGEKSKLRQCTPTIKVKSDGEIPFIVIDKNKMASNIGKGLNNFQNKKYDFGNDLQNIMTPREHLNEKIESKENFIENKNDIKMPSIKSLEFSEKIDKAKQILSEKIVNDNITETKKMISDKMNESNNILLDGNIEKMHTISEKNQSVNQDFHDDIDQSMKNDSEKKNNTKKISTDKVNQVNKIMPVGTTNTVTDKLDETKSITLIKSNQIEKYVSDIINETEKTFSNKNDNVVKKIGNEDNEIKRIKTYKTNDIEKQVDDEAHNSKKTIMTKINDTKKIISKKSNEISEILSDKINDMEKNVSEAKKLLFNESDIIKKSITEKIKSDTVDEIKQTGTNKINLTESILSDEMDKLEKNVPNKIYEIETFVSNEINEIKKPSYKINDIKENDNIDENKKIKLNENKELNINIDEESVKNNMYGIIEIENEVNKNSDWDLKSNINDTVVKNIDDLTSDKLNEIVKNQSIVNEIENINFKEELLELEFVGLSNEVNEKTKISNDIGTNEIKNQSFSELNKNKFGNIGMEMCEKENMPANLMHNEKETKEVPQMKQLMETQIDEQIHRNEDSILQKNLKKNRETTLSEVAHLGDSKNTEDITMKSFQHMQEANLLELSENNTNKEKFVLGIEKKKKILILSSSENKEESRPKKDFSRQMTHQKKTILEFPNSISSIKVDEEESDNDSSNATDISNKTALRTKPYRTPRHSISSDEIDETLTPKPGKGRQKWSSEKEKDVLVQIAVYESRESSVKVSPRKKTEITSPDKPKISTNKSVPDQTKVQKSSTKEIRQTSTSQKSVESTQSKMSNNKQRTGAPRTKPMIVGVKKKDHLQKPIPTREKTYREKTEDKKSPQKPNPWENRSRLNTEQRKVEIRSKHLQLQVSHRSWRSKDDVTAVETGCVRDFFETPSPMQELRAEKSPRTMEHGKDPDIASARSRYMAWYHQKRVEMERKRRDRKDAMEDRVRPRWLQPRTSAKGRKAKSAENIDQLQDNKGRRSKERAKSLSDTGGCRSALSRLGRFSVSQSRLRIRPLVNVESEQLKAIVRQGRKLRKAEGAREEPEIQIFALEKPPQPRGIGPASLNHLEPRHHLTQHSEYKYEKEVPPMPFYLHPPPTPTSTLENVPKEDSPENQGLEDDLDSGIAVSLQGGTRLRHQQLLEKKSVFDIAYNEAAPTQLRSDSSTPPT